MIWANEDWTRRWNGYEGNILIKQEYKETDPYNFIKDIKKYIIDERYIKINNKSILGIYEPIKIPNLSNTISIWREESKNMRIGELYFINSIIVFLSLIFLYSLSWNLFIINIYSFDEMKNIKLFEGVYEFSPRDSLQLMTKDKSYFLYSFLLYKNIDFINANDDFPLYRGSMNEFDNSPRKKKDSSVFKFYSPEQFYMVNKKIVEWTRNKYNKNNRFIFINAWNEWGEGAYLEPDSKFGYASINSLSKALFDRPYKEIKMNHTYFNNESIVAIQVHLYYDDLIEEIVNKTNNIHIFFDLYISTDSLYKKNKIIDYICHIHTKKSLFIDIGDNWRNYLYNNLLGNEDIISQILFEFESNDKLGFFFPENYYKALLLFGEKLSNKNKSFMKYLLNKLFDKFNLNISSKIEFPIGNMFLARINSIYQIFNEDFKNEIPKELGQKDGTIMHGIERIWLYLVKLNGYYYKKFFKHF